MSSITSATPDAQHPLLALALVEGLRGGAFRRLCEAFGSCEAVLQQPWRRLAEALPPALAQRVRAGPDEARIAAALAWASVPGHALCLLTDAAYPARLRELPDPPPLLWLNGQAALLHRPALAIIGSRRATPQGLRDARAFARHLGTCGLTVVSGLAEGIDGAAHEGAQDTLGSTVAVLAHGLDRIYPPRHRALAHQLTGQGLLVSEFPLGTPALRPHFPERNRLISGLSLGVLVVEATVSSGSLVTARHGMEQGREVMALPGSIHSAQSKGCHQLIREGATLVESAAHVWQQLAPALRASGVDTRAGPGPEGPAEPLEDAHPVLRALLAGPLAPDALVELIGLTPFEVSDILGREELEGRVVRLQDGRYQRLAAEPDGLVPDRPG